MAKPLSMDLRERPCLYCRGHFRPAGLPSDLGRGGEREPLANARAETR
jgi:hypothetical protein